MFSFVSRLGLLFLFSAAWACGDESQSPEPVDADTSQDASIQPIVPMPGVWQSTGLGFSIGDDGRIDRLSFSGFGCIGPMTLAGVPTCESRLHGELVVHVSILKDQPKFSFNTIFGLHLDGEFVSDDRVEGLFTYTADNGCCTSSGQWSGVHESLYEVAPPTPCHSQITGDEVLEFGQAEAGESFTALNSTETLVAVTGFQGAIMVVGAIRLVGVSLGGLNVTLEVSINGGQVVSKLTSNAPKFKDQEDGSSIWSGLYLILEDKDGNLLHPTDTAQIALIQNQPATITVRVENPCGFSKQSVLNLTTVY